MAGSKLSRHKEWERNVNDLRLYPWAIAIVGSLFIKNDLKK